MLHQLTYQLPHLGCLGSHLRSLSKLALAKEEVELANKELLSPS